MKKIVFFLTFLICILAGTVAMANDETVYVEFDEGEYLLSEYSLYTEPQLMEDYSALEQKVIAAWENLESEIDISEFEIHQNDIAETYWRICHNNPRYYYVQRKYGGSAYSDSGNMAYLSFYYTESDKAVIDAQLKAIDDATEEILMCITDDMTDFQKVMTVHDYMVMNYEYDLTKANHTITIMTTKTGVCESYAFAFIHVMKLLGIDCVLVQSDEANHAWNLVKVGGDWYHIDLTHDDPTYDKYAQVRHTYALLSSDKLNKLNKIDEGKHKGFDLGELKADSKKYDNANWHNSVADIVAIGGKTYWVEDFSIKCSDGTTIYENLGTVKWWGQQIWELEKGYFENCYAGLAAYGDKLYFNTDDAIKCYDTVAGNIEIVKEIKSTCGIFIHNNVLNYNKYDDSSNGFVYAGSITLAEAAIGEPHEEDGKIVTTVYKDSEEPLLVFCLDGGALKTKVVENNGISKVSFDKTENPRIFFWTNNLKPLKPAVSVGN